jgi:hypothetical protein
MEAAVDGLVTLITNSYITTYGERVLALTPDFAKLSISPESSDGFASVGTILPKEEAALLPGGLFAFRRVVVRGVQGRVSQMRRLPRKKSVE